MRPHGYIVSHHRFPPRSFDAPQGHHEAKCVESRQADSMHRFIVSVVPDQFLPQPFQRKRTASFSISSTSLSASPRPTKAPRTSAMGLRRTESYLTLPSIASTSVAIVSAQGFCKSSQSQPSTVPYQQSLQYYKDQRQRRKAATRANWSSEPITIRTRLEHTYSQPQAQHSTTASTSPPPSRSRSLTRTATLLDVTTRATDESISSTSESTSTPAHFRAPPSFRASSPLSPKRHLLPGRPVFPRSKPEPDLYRLAIKTCMRCSPEGQKILRMGPRLALSILTATQDLERIVAEQESREDAMMEDRSVTNSEEPSGPSLTLSNSWVDVRHEDWEMVDCSA
ncbi:hypothetical protein P691DRAFT_797347 [Macrolepiota fuliginosa MF-IS2]|uniref:Uncharacterized protein n=1 Tax=Macrolepiota fuliginosa MF-IS2 TaxID=1400762 RepID=A0A9P6BZC4_9AGAR|nr:hypothetical protein P691DRAFT_797347 [Macrolepiota fuliginosa MF-IS2]